MSDYEEINDTTDSLEIRADSLHLKGVDKLSTSSIKEYVQRYISNQEFKIEWINDSSLNIVFDSAKIASEALTTLTREYEDKLLEPTVERDARVFSKSEPDVELAIRIAKTTDKKVKNASDSSRYYMYNPEERVRYKNDRINYKNIDVPLGFREREERRRKPVRDEDDLFPSLLKDQGPREKPRSNDDVSMDSMDPLPENDLFSRIKPKSNNNSSDDLFSRIQPNSNSSEDLFSRIKPVDRER
ncbi:hypothetical protein WICPIJ_004840 [Wickerhamomyces pijperi]|uniref:Uncharacterized protein n=1 Tax=Wickerhamomyces pijperi TaxID=599730 RepID=A0A9P8Q4N9_WICPI|nr:hypothetical protein WICPIJ_004840 [Wickerhamomyces pijperi]